jgi:altronate dehydratase small subunit
MNKVIGIIINEIDNVCTLVSETKKGALVSCRLPKHIEQKIEIYAKDDIPIYHKMAIKDLSLGCDIMKYGYSIGKAKNYIKQGEYVHIHNVDSKRVQGDL